MSNVVFELFAKLGLDSSEYEKGLEGAENKASSIGGTLTKGLGAVGKAGALVTTAIAGATTAAGVALVKGAGDVAAYGDNIDKMSQKMGISAQAYQEWDAVLQHSGTSIDSMSRGMQTLQKNAANSAEKFEALGLSQEQVANMSTEELFSATIEGLQNMGEGAERTALASELLGGSAKELGALLNTSSEDTQAMKDRLHELGGVMSDDAVKAAAAYQDSLQDMTTGFDSLKRNLLSEFLPSITGVMDGLTDIFTGDYESGLSKISDGITEMVSGITQKLPQIAELGTTIIQALFTAVTQNLPIIIDAGIQILVQLGQSIIQALPLLIDGAIQIITQLTNYLLQNASQMVEGAIGLLTGLAQAIIENLPVILPAIIQLILAIALALVDNLPTLVQAVIDVNIALVQAIVENAPLILDACLQILLALVQLLIQYGSQFISKAGEIASNVITSVVRFISQLPEKIAYWVGAAVKSFVKFMAELPDKAKSEFEKVLTKLKDFGTKFKKEAPEIAKKFITDLVTKMKELPGKLVEIGKNVVEGLKQGIENAWDSFMSWIKSKIEGIVGAFLKGFDEHSPSKVMAKIGENAVLGLKIGMDDEIPSIEDTIGDILDIATAPIDITTSSKYNQGGNNGFDYDTLAKTIINAFVDAGIGVEVDGREFGRIVRKAVAY